MSSAPAKPPVSLGFAGRLASIFINSKLTPIAIIAAILLGGMSILLLPREEEPQIKVPMVDVLIAMPGATAQEVENRVTRPVEKLLWEIAGIDYLYSTSSPGGSMIIARFKVGTDLETALVRLNQKLQTNFDRIPLGVSSPLIKPRTIDDVPILALTFHSAVHDHTTLRRIAAQVENEIKSIQEVAETTVIGGQRRAVRVALDPAALAAHNLSAAHLVPMLQQANRSAQIGSRPVANTEVLLEVGPFLADVHEVGAVMVGAFQNRPIYLRDVATITDGAEEVSNYVLHGEGGPNAPSDVEAAVTLSLAKRPGANAIDVVSKVMAKVDALHGTLIPDDITVTVSRDYGHTAAEKSNELLLHMGIAIFGVAVLIFLFLGWRESVVVMFAIPTTLAMTLLVFYLYGYTLNRITLFALIFSIGILVDDAIVVVENIVRHTALPGARRRSFLELAVEAVDEVGNPTILATFAVVAAVLPMAFVSGMMGPYMRPIPIGSSAAMLFSLVIAFTVTPWVALRMLAKYCDGHAPAHADPASADAPSDQDQSPSNLFTRTYRRVMDPLMNHPTWQWLFLGVVAFLLVGSAALVLIGGVKVKMLPFDNKSEFQIIVNTPEGTTLEQTLHITREMAKAIRTEPEVRDYQIYAGTASPFNFNGLVRHYFMRRGPNVADIQVNLVGKDERSAQSHDIAKRMRPALAKIAAKHGASVAVAEVPPGPPVLQTLVAEIYSPDETQRIALARRVRDIFEASPGVVDVDWYVEDAQPKTRFIVDQEKAAFHGITTEAIIRTLELAARGYPVGLLHVPTEKEDITIILELPDSAKSRPEDLLALQLRSDFNPAAPLVPLSELVRLEHTTGERNLYRKNLKPVTYVTGDVAGAVESPVYAILAMNKDLAKIDAREFGGSTESLEIYHASLPFDDHEPSMKWDGEWHVTIEVFRDLGLAFGAVLILIYMLMVGWFKNYTTPLIVMTVIPFSLIGILPAHWGMGAFFTATSMIGFMAGAGIVVRNSIIIVDFIELRMSHGQPLKEACVESGAVRFRPMLLTALAVVVGAAVILADPIFQGLAISLLFGALASLLISPLAVPMLYYMVNRNQQPT
jgi:multidrug efflux pump subunit AcrB